MPHPARVACYFTVGTLGFCSSVDLYALDAESDPKSSYSARLETLTVMGNSLYSMSSSEQTGGYSVDSAYVGTKTPAALRDIPQSVNVMTYDVIRDQNDHTLDQLARNTPGLRILTNDAGRSSIYSRGYEYDSFEINGLSAPMSSMMGTVPQLAAFDRVEIMSGPSGLFDSSSEMGGIINLRLKRPTHEFQGSIKGSYGNWQQRYLESDLSGPLDKAGHLRGRVVIANDYSHGFVRHNTNDDNTFYGTLAADLDADTELNISFLRQTYRINPYNGVGTRVNGALLDVPRNTSFGAHWDTFRNQSNDWIGELGHHFKSGGYGHIGIRYSHRDVSFNYLFGGGRGVSPAGKTLVAGMGMKARQNAVSADANFSQPFSTFGQVSEFVIGADYKRYSTQTQQGSSMNLLGKAIGYRDIAGLSYINVLGVAGGTSTRPEGYTGKLGFSHQRTVLEDYGLYSKLTFRPVSRLALIGGVRLSAYQQSLHDYKAPQRDAKRHEHLRATPYGGMVVDLNDAHSLYGSYSRVLNPQTQMGAEGTPLKARKGEQYEVGVKGSYHDGKLNARVSAFRLYDKHRAAPIVNQPGLYTALGKTRIQGAEAEISGRLMDNLNVVAGYTYLSTKVLQTGDMRRDGLFLLMPKHVGNLWTDYTFTRGRFDRLTLGAGVNVLSDISSSQGIHGPGYAVVNAMLAYDITPRLRAQLNVNNIFDRKYYERVALFNTFNMYGAPRNGMATLTYQF